MRHTIIEQSHYRVEAILTNDPVPPPEYQGLPTVVMHYASPLTHTIATWAEGVDTDSIARAWIASGRDVIDFGRWLNANYESVLDWDELDIDGHKEPGEPRTKLVANIQLGKGYVQGETYVVIQFVPADAPDAFEVEEVELFNWALGNVWHLQLTRRDVWKNLRTGELDERWEEQDHDYEYAFFAEDPTEYSYIVNISREIVRQAVRAEAQNEVTA